MAITTPCYLVLRLPMDECASGTCPTNITSHNDIKNASSCISLPVSGSTPLSTVNMASKSRTIHFTTRQNVNETSQSISFKFWPLQTQLIHFCQSMPFSLRATREPTPCEYSNATRDITRRYQPLFTSPRSSRVWTWTSSSSSSSCTLTDSHFLRSKFFCKTPKERRKTHRQPTILQLPRWRPPDTRST